MKQNLSKETIKAIESILSRGDVAKVETTKNGIKVMSMRTKVEFLETNY